MDIAFSPFYLNAFNINTANYKYNQMASSHLEISIVCNTQGIKVSTSQLWFYHDHYILGAILVEFENRNPEKLWFIRRRDWHELVSIALYS